jgi:hypothetical protein
MSARHQRPNPADNHGILSALGHMALVLLLSAAGIASAENTVEAVEKAQQPEKESPWIFTPTVSSDPKVGTTLGLMAGYLKKMDAKSTPSMFLASGKYSDTDSWTGALFGQMYFDENRQRLILGYGGGKIRNDYDDFLDSGQPAQTTDEFTGLFARYLHRFGDNWYLGGQAISSNYAIGADAMWKGILDLVGLTGFDSNGIGVVAEYDTRDNPRNPSGGTRFLAHNIAYRQTFGGDESFDVYNAQYNDYRTLNVKNTVLATQISARGTHNAPAGGYSSLNLRGYVRGQALAPIYTGIQTDARIPLSERWGLSAFTGVGCLYEKLDDCGDTENLYPMIGGGVIFLLKKDAGLVVRAEYAVGKSGNSGLYLNLGHPF